MVKRISKKIRIRIIAAILCLGLVSGLAWALFHPSESNAAWFDDNYAYRTNYTFTHNATVTNGRLDITINTSTLVSAGKMQSSCADSRFTDISGKKLRYQLVSGCNTSSTSYSIVIPSVVSGLNSYYFYYGNAAAISLSDSTVSSVTSFTPSGGSPVAATEEKAPGPIVYWKFNDGTGTNAQDSSQNNFDGTITNMASPATPTSGWQTEDKCVFGKCLAFDGTNDYVTLANSTVLNPGTGGFTLSAWIKTGSTASSIMEIIRKDDTSATIPSFAIRLDSSHHAHLFTNNGTTTYQATGTTALNDNRWHYISGVRDTGTNTLRLYVDGIQVATGAETNFNLAPGGPLEVGRDKTVGEYFQGYIDEPKMYNYARSAAQIQADFESRGSTITTANSVGSTDPSRSLSNGLVGYWKMDESSWTNNCSTASVLDSSGNGNNGTACPNLTGPTGGASGKFGNAGSFDGSNDYVDLSNPTSLAFGTNSLSISMWVNASSGVNAFDTAFYKGGDSSGHAGIDFELGTGSWKTSISDGGGTNFLTATFGQESSLVSKWTHLVAVVDRTDNKLKVYANGTLADSQNISAFGSITSTRNASIGADGTDSLNYFSGKIDDVRIYNRALSDQEVSTLYDWAPGPVAYWNLDERTGSTANDISSNANTGTITGTTTWANGKLGAGLTFDGANSGKIDAGSGSSIDDPPALSLGAWIYPHTIGQNNDSRIITKTLAGPTNGWYLTLNSTNAIKFQYDYATTDLVRQSSNNAITMNAWNYVSVTWDESSTASNAHIYVNGIEVSYATTTDGVGTKNLDNTANLYIGNSVSGNRTFDGIIDEVKMYNYIRTQKQIIQDMNGNRPAIGGEAGTNLAYWKFEEGQGTTANSTGNGSTALLGTLNNMSSPATTTSGWTNAGKFGRALLFDGTNDFVNIPDSSTVDLAGSFTLSAWVKRGTLTQNSYGILAKGNLSSISPTNSSYGIFLDATDKYELRVSKAGTSLSNITTTLAYADLNWHHVVGRYTGIADGSSLLDIYVDGKKAGTQITNAQYPPFNSSAPLRIGSTVDNTNTGTWFWNGAIDEAKIYNYPLSDDEIKLEYNQGKSEVMGSFSTTSDGNTPSTSTDRIYCVPGDTTSCSGPIGEWNFDERTGTSVSDTSGNAKTGTWNGTGSHWIAGKFNAAGSFNNSDDYVAVSSPSLPTGDFSYSLWAKVNTDSANDDTLLEGLNSTAGNEFNIYLTAGNTLQVTVNEAASIDVGYSAYLDKWTHIEVTRSGSTVNVYINGVLANTGTSAGTLDFSTCSLIFGMDADSTTSNCTGSTGNFLNGSLDQIRIYNYARTVAQVAWDYNRGGPVAWWKFNECQGTTINDSSGNSNTGTMTIGATSTYTSAGSCNSGTSTQAWNAGSTGKFNSALGFDGTDDYVSVASSNSLNITDDLTLAAWVKPTALDSAYHEIFFKGTSTGSARQYGFRIGNTNKWQVCLTVATGPTETCITDGNSTPSTTAWSHFVVTRAGSAVKMYINGIQTTSGTISGTLNTTSNALAIGRIGATSAEYYSGLIDDARIYNYALTLKQIQTLYNENSAVRYGPVTGSP